MQAQRDNAGKIDWTLIDFESLRPLVQVLEFGAQKYARDNWKQGGDKMTREEINKSLTRHLFAYLSGEDLDPESGCKHLGHMMANLMFLEFYSEED